MNDQPGLFLLEVMFRSLVMFFVLLVVLKLAGKRGIKQLSIFELVVIISLGSAAGDPMFYEDVGVIHGILVLVVVLLLYRVLTWITGKSARVEKFLEGKPECLLSEGKLTQNQYAGDHLGRDEFFSMLRVHNVEHLGQVKKAYLETSGDVSIFFYEDAEVKPGLPILPGLDQAPASQHPTAARCCCRCGEVTEAAGACQTCGGTQWVAPLTTKRIG